MLINLAHVALARGAYAEAEELLEHSLARAREDGIATSIAWALRSLGTVACHRGAFERAAALHRQALPLYDSNRWGMLECIVGLAIVAAGEGQQARGRRGCTRRLHTGGPAARHGRGAAAGNRLPTRGV